jgi:hypothetical protein
MATYVVIQDIEAEDKLLGPLSLRQFLYAVITVVLGFVMFQVFPISPLLSIPFLPPALLFATLAAPFGRDQPSEVWLLAKIRFILKPRRRIWDQSGLQELVTITVPKKIERQLTDGLSQNEVQSRLKALANTIDTRGWAVKGMNTNIAANPAYFSSNSQRLFDMNALMPAVNPDAQVPIENDPLASYSPVAQQFTQMVAASDQAHRQQIMDKMDQIRVQQFTQDNLPAPTPAVPAAPVAQQAPVPAQNYVPASPVSSTTPQPTMPLPQPLVTSQQVAYGNTHILQPLQTQASPVAATDNSVTAPNQAAKMELAQNNDLNVATIARQANKNDGPQDEVVISLR